MGIYALPWGLKDLILSSPCPGETENYGRETFITHIYLYSYKNLTSNCPLVILKREDFFENYLLIPKSYLPLPLEPSETP